MTNFEKIKAMSVEEMAEYMADMFDCDLCSEDKRLGDCLLTKTERCDEQCAKHCKEYLEREVEDNGELKPCPFCGGKAKVYDYEVEHYIFDPVTPGYIDTEYETVYGCDCECGCNISERKSKEEAIEAWNRRDNNV